MKLLARTARDLRRLGSPGGGFTLLVLSIALALEVLGRQSDSDLHDLLAAVTLSILLPAAMIHDQFVAAAHAGAARRVRRGELLALGAYFGSLLVLHVVLPPAFMPVACLVTLAVYLTAAVLAPHSDVQFLWRPRGTIRVRSITWGRCMTW